MSTSSAAETSPPTEERAAGAWFVCLPGGDPVGPVTTDQVARGLAKGKVPRYAQVASAGDAQWRAVLNVPEIVSAFEALDRSGPPVPAFAILGVTEVSNDAAAADEAPQSAAVTLRTRSEVRATVPPAPHPTRTASSLPPPPPSLGRDALARTPSRLPPPSGKLPPPRAPSRPPASAAPSTPPPSAAPAQWTANAAAPGWQAAPAQSRNGAPVAWAAHAPPQAYAQAVWTAQAAAQAQWHAHAHAQAQHAHPAQPSAPPGGWPGQPQHAWGAPQQQAWGAQQQPQQTWGAPSLPATAAQAAWGAVPAAPNGAPPMPAAWQAPAVAPVEMPNPHVSAPPLPAPWSR